MSAQEKISRLRERMTEDVLQRTLPFWIHHAVDREHGGFYGRITNDMRVWKEEPKTLVICARVLWTYSCAYRLFDKPEFLDMANWARDYLLGPFWDQTRSGLFWQVSYRGEVASDRKQTYGQAFGLYALSEHYRATRQAKSLERAIEIFNLIERSCFDSALGGYWEARGRDWQPLDDMRLSPRDMNCPKSMNTMLHVMEAYTNLLRVWPDARLKGQQARLLQAMLARVVTSSPYPHFALFFEADWTPVGDHISFGHDIEGSWLLAEAAEVLGDRELSARAREAGLRLAEAVYEHAVEEDGSILYEAGPEGILNTDKHWWPHAEAVVGFLNAYELTGEHRFLDAAIKCWDYIEERFIDPINGEWWAKLNRQGAPYPDYPADPDQCKVGPWKCPYHNSRACFEVFARGKGKA
jgi:mannobiose 2-epimerase